MKIWIQQIWSGPEVLHSENVFTIVCRCVTPVDEHGMVGTLRRKDKSRSGCLPPLLCASGIKLVARPPEPSCQLKILQFL